MIASPFAHFFAQLYKLCVRRILCVLHKALKRIRKLLDRTFHIRIDDELYDALKIEAERQDRSMAAQNRAILRRALIEEKLEHRTARMIGGSRSE